MFTDDVSMDLGQVGGLTINDWVMWASVVIVSRLRCIYGLVMT